MDDRAPARGHAEAPSPFPGAPIHLLLDALGTGVGGLSRGEAQARLEALGPNEVDERRGRTALAEILRSVTSPLVLILLVASLLSALLGEVVDAGVIATVVGLSIAVNTWQSSRSRQAVRRLQSAITPTATVLRDGAWSTIPRREVVVGDVIRLSAGDLVPADARLLTAADLYVQQSALTGEPLPVEKRVEEGVIPRLDPDAPGLVWVGTSVVSGAATAVVYATGRQTAFGDIVARLAARPEETEFDRGARKFGILILQAVTFLVLLILVVSLTLGRDAFQSFLFAVALAVGLTPEFLPMITTVTLADGAVRMSRRKVIVKHLASIQNLGSIDVLCSDKTGTLTSGNISLQGALDPEGRLSERVLLLATLNSGFETGVRSPMDEAIIAAGAHLQGGLEGYEKVAEIPFDFDRRRLSVALLHRGERLLVTKGAPESVLSCCVGLEADGAALPLDPAGVAGIERRIAQWGHEGTRVLAVATRILDPEEAVSREGERGLVLAGFLTFSDPMLPGVSDSIASLFRDGVQVKILTGDDLAVARHLCEQAGIDASRVVTGAEVDLLDSLALSRVAEEAHVFARVSPAQKHRIVLALKHGGHVVGFLGDGINDAPSLHGADVGISVAGAVDVAQEASDIILGERRLDVLHAGILLGRRSFGNVLKYLLMGTSSNFGNMLSMAAAVFFLPFLPMLPTQILVNNFLYDLAQITIPTDRVDPIFVKRPQRWDMGLVRRFMLAIGPISSIFDFLTFAAFLFVFRLDERSFQSGWFMESLSTQVLVLFVIRTVGRPWQSRPSAALSVTACAVVAFGLALPYTAVGAPLGMVPLPPTFYLFLALVIPTYLFSVDLVKGLLIRRILGSSASSPAGESGR